MFKKNMIFIILCIVMGVILVGYYFDVSNREQQDIISIATDAPTPDNNKTQSLAAEKQRKYRYADDFRFFGTWRLEKIVLVTDRFLNEEYIKSPIGVPVKYVIGEGYIGTELEYTEEFMRLNDEKFLSPKYKVYDFILSDYNNNGDFTSSVYDVIENEVITVDVADEYDNIGDVPLLYFLVTLEGENYSHTGVINYTPIGDQCVLLNKDTMLVGVWGKVFLARRVEK